MCRFLYTERQVFSGMKQKMSLTYHKKYDKILRDLLTVEGRSFAEPILTPDGKEDYAKSRRVELKLRVQGNTLTKVFGLSFGDN